MAGKLIVIEGLDGCGKNTQTKLLKQYLTEKNLPFKYVSFPDYEQPSSELVKMYLRSEFGSKPSDVNAYAAASFYAVDRFASYKKFWKNDYSEGKIIICDRYTTSNTFYHMPKLSPENWDNYLTWLYDYEYNKLELPKPDCVIYLNVPVDISQNLMQKRYDGDSSKKDLHESDTDFLQKCRKAAEYVCKKSGWAQIDCTENGKIKTIDQIHSEIINFLEGDVII